jgi:hypothetical protein
VKIWLTDFVDFSIRSGPSKVTKVREIKNRPAYEPAFDLWKPLREGIAGLPKAARTPREELDAVIDAQDHATKLKLYPAAVAGFLSFLGKKPPEWIGTPRGVWRHDLLQVAVNPEIGLKIRGEPTIIKLYFKSDELTRPRVQASIGVMQAELGPKVGAGTRFSVLDVKAGKLHVQDGRWKPADTQILIRAEAQSFISIWDSV